MKTLLYFNKRNCKDSFTYTTFAPRNKRDVGRDFDSNTTCKTMHIPVKISPEYIHSVIIEIRYQSSVLYPLLVAKILAKNEDGVEKFELVTINNQNDNLGIIGPNHGTSFLRSKNLLIHLLPGAFVISLNDKYPGWETCKKDLIKFLALSDNDSFQRIVRLGMKYTSLFENILPKDFTKFSADHGVQGREPYGFQYNEQFFKAGFKVNMVIGHGDLNVQKTSFGRINVKDLKGSHIDIDVISSETNLPDYSGIIDYLDRQHDLQNEIFYSLLSEKGIQTLKKL